MRVLVLFLALMSVSGTAQADLCDADWLEQANGSAVIALIRAGADVDAVCDIDGNRPLHLAILRPALDPSVLRALVAGGADTLAPNIGGATPSEYAATRWDRANSAFREGSAAHRRELAIYSAVVRGGDAGAAVSSPLCDPEWWRSAASESSVRALLARPGTDPEARCNRNNDRPLHVALRWDTFPALPAGVKDGILHLAAAGVSLDATNDAGRSAMTLAEIRYDRYLARAMRVPPAWCQGGEADPDIELYLGLTYLTTNAALETLVAATRRDLCGDAGGDVRRRAGAVFRECDVCPEMIVMPGGELALGRYEVTVREYDAFASATGGGAGSGCYTIQRRSENETGGEMDPSASWRNPGFPQTGNHPVVCVSWRDAQQYVSWLSRMTGATYRLPSGDEWGRAAGGSGGGCSVNGGDRSFARWHDERFGVSWELSGSLACQGSDGSPTTAAVGSYGSNGVGLSDTVGNVWEWTAECWQGDCGRRLVRGGSWYGPAESLGAGSRDWLRAGDRDADTGFRVARTLD